MSGTAHYPVKNKPPVAKRINPGNRKARIGYMTVAICHKVEIALFHPTLLGLEIAFNAVTQGRTPYDPSQVNRVNIYKEESDQ